MEEENQNKELQPEVQQEPVPQPEQPAQVEEQGIHQQPEPDLNLPPQEEATQPQAEGAKKAPLKQPKPNNGNNGLTLAIVIAVVVVIIIALLVILAYSKK